MWLIENMWEKETCYSLKLPHLSARQPIYNLIVANAKRGTVEDQHLAQIINTKLSSQHEEFFEENKRKKMLDETQ